MFVCVEVSGFSGVNIDRDTSKRSLFPWVSSCGNGVFGCELGPNVGY